MLLGRVKDFTRAFTTPEGWDLARNGRVATLYVRDDIKPYGNEMVSAWYPKPDELQRLNAGAPVHLAVLGGAHPPVRIDVGQAPDRVKPWPKLVKLFLGECHKVIGLEFAGSLSVEQADAIKSVFVESKAE